MLIRIRANGQTKALTEAGLCAVWHALSYPDYTVGSGVTPDLLTLLAVKPPASARGLQRNKRCYRRWGISPRPENDALSAGW